MIFVEDNTIKLNGVVLPGLVKSIEVKESAQIDEQEVEGSSTKPKQATGYEDAKINIELVVDAPIQDIQSSYPGTPLRLGAVGQEVVIVQTMLNRISQNYPAIPKIRPVIGAYDENTEAAVKEFQRIFNLTPDGIVGKATWYKMVYLYVGVTKLSELVSQGQTFFAVQFQFPGVLREGSSGTEVEVLQYMLALLAEFDNALSPLQIDGVFGPNTARAVRSYQQVTGLTVDGVVGPVTWDSIYRHFIQADQYLRRDMGQFPRDATQAVPASVSEVGSAAQGYENTTRLGQYPGYEMKLGQTDGREAVMV